MPNPGRFKRVPFPAWSLNAVKFLCEERGVTAIGHGLDTDTTEKMGVGKLGEGTGREVKADLDRGPGDDDNRPVAGTRSKTAMTSIR